MPRSRTSPTRNSRPTRWFSGAPRVTTFRRASPGAIASSLSRAIASIASDSISTRTCGSINRLTWSKVAAGRICWKNSACARPTFSQSSMFVTNMRVRITSSSWAPASARAASIVRKMWTAWPYASPGATTFPSGSVAVVPATATWLPMRTTREYPTIGSQRPPDATFFRSMERRIGRAAKRVAPSRGFPELDVRRDLRQPGRDRAFRMLQEVRQFVRGLFGDRGRVFPSAELPPAPFLERFQGSGQLAPEGVVSRPIVDRRDNDEFPADRDDPQTLVTHCGDGIAGGQGDARFDEVPDDGQKAFELLGPDREVPARGEGHEGLPGAVEHVDRGDALLNRGRPPEGPVPIVSGQRKNRRQDQGRGDDEKGRGPQFVERGCQRLVDVRRQREGDRDETDSERPDGAPPESQ